MTRSECCRFGIYTVPFLSRFSIQHAPCTQLDTNKYVRVRIWWNCINKGKCLGSIGFLCDKHVTDFKQFFHHHRHDFPIPLSHTTVNSLSLSSVCSRRIEHVVSTVGWLYIHELRWLALVCNMYVHTCELFWPYTYETWAEFRKPGLFLFLSLCLDEQLPWKIFRRDWFRVWQVNGDE